jgi:hypothetical protein
VLLLIVILYTFGGCCSVLLVIVGVPVDIYSTLYHLLLIVVDCCWLVGVDLLNLEFVIVGACPLLPTFVLAVSLRLFHDLFVLCRPSPCPTLRSVISRSVVVVAGGSFGGVCCV